MKNLGKITLPQDIATKEYVDNSIIAGGEKDTGWIFPTLANHFVVYSVAGGVINYKPRYRRIGHLVSIMGAMSPKTTTTLAKGADNVLAFTLPIGFRPPTEIVTISQGSVRNIFLSRVHPTTGNFSVGRYRVADAYPASVGTATWLPFNISYFTDNAFPG